MSERERQAAELDRELAENERRNSERGREADHQGNIGGWAIALAFVVLIPSLVGIVMVEREARIRSNVNTTLIEQSNEIRRDLVAGFKRADVLQCRATEKLKEQNRADAKRNYAERERSAELLDIELTPALEEALAEQLDEALTRNARRPGPGLYGCGDLPPRKAVVNEANREPSDDG